MLSQSQNMQLFMSKTLRESKNTIGLQLLPYATDAIPICIKWGCTKCYPSSACCVGPPAAEMLLIRITPISCQWLIKNKRNAKEINDPAYRLLSFQALLSFEGSS